MYQMAHISHLPYVEPHGTMGLVEHASEVHLPELIFEGADRLAALGLRLKVLIGTGDLHRAKVVERVLDQEAHKLQLARLAGRR